METTAISDIGRPSGLGGENWNVRVPPNVYVPEVDRTRSLLWDGS